MYKFLYISMLGVLLASEASAKTVSYGLAIGYNAAPEKTALPTLRYADDDAVRYYRHFRRLSDDSVLLAILDDETFRRYPELRSEIKAPTWRELTTVLKRFAQQMQADRDHGDEPIFYFAYSGHGAANKNGAIFLTLADAELTQDKLYDDLLAKLPFSYAHLFVDACHADAVVGARGMFDKGETSAQNIKLAKQEVSALADATRLKRFPNVGAIIATTADQEAHEWSRLQAGVFTHEVLSGLAGAADTNGDGSIEYSELQAFVMSANRTIVDPRAAPRVIAAPPIVNRRVPIVTLDAFRNTSTIEGNVASLGHFFIELANGERYLDANLGPDAPRKLVLPKERVLFVRTDSEEAEVLTLSKQVTRFSELRLRPRQVAMARGSIDESYRTALFQSPYTASYYQGVVDSMGLPTVDMGGIPEPEKTGPTKLVEKPNGFVKLAEKYSEPRKDRWIGLQVTAGMDALGAFGLTSFLFQHVQISALFDPVSVGFNLEARGLILKSRWSPYVSIGGKLNIPRNAAPPVQVWFQATHFNIGIGAQYFSPSGFFLDLGIVWIPPFPDFVKLQQSTYLAIPLPHLSLGWAFSVGGK